jgi:excisionase family DNA binding protein
MLSTTQVADLAKTTRSTVEREIHRGNLTAEKAGRVWVVQDGEAQRWAAEFEPYASLRVPRTKD